VGGFEETILLGLRPASLLASGESAEAEDFLMGNKSIKAKIGQARK
jgi:hypothetical protein